MAQSELFVLPSAYEPHGIVVEEAMAVGTPVIASNDCGAARDLVHNGKTGWLFKSGDVAGLSHALLAAVGYAYGHGEISASCRSEFARWYGRYEPLVIIPEFLRAAPEFRQL
jgi:glycosyltransferase involved in cell wall biosynthesis